MFGVSLLGVWSVGDERFEIRSNSGSYHRKRRSARPDSLTLHRCVTSVQDRTTFSLVAAMLDLRCWSTLGVCRTIWHEDIAIFERSIILVLYVHSSVIELGGFWECARCL